MTRLFSVMMVAVAVVIVCAGVAAAMPPVPYFSQYDSRWSNDQLGGDCPERVVDVSKTALDALDVETEDTVNIEFAELGVVSAASDSTEQIKSSEEVVTLVDEQYIPKSVQAMKSRRESESVNEWEDAKAGIPILQYWLNEGKHKIEPHFWIIPVKKDDNTVGFIGVDPYTGKFAWRTLDVDKSYKIQRPSNSTFENLVELQRFGGGYDISKVKLVLIRDNNYWLIPLKDGDVNNSVLVDYNITNSVEKFGYSSPEILGSITKVSEILTKPFGGFKPEVGWVKGVPARKFSKKIINSRGQIVEASNLGGTSNTRIKDKIPYYKQDCSQWCWAACLAMMHQWWSPAEIGTSYYQEAQKIVKYEKGSIVCDGADLDEIVHVLNNWDQVDNNKNDYDGVAYEDWITADGDTNGKEFNKNDNPTGCFNDPKSWIYYFDSPVLLGVDTNGDETGNHAILCVGYDDNDNDGVAFINDPWYGDSFVPGIQSHNYAIGVSYDYLNEVWTQSGLLWDDRVWASGYPGCVTYDLADTSISLKNCPNAIYDDEEALITIEMDILDDDTAYTTAYFGEWAESGIHVRTTSSDGVTGTGMIKVDSKGNFNGWAGYSGRNGDVVCDSSSSSTGEAKIFEFYTNNNNQEDKLSVSFKIDPSDTGTIMFYYRSWVYDWDNRVHFPDTSNDALWINVLDDRGGDDTDFTMPKPLKRDASDPSAWLYQNYLDVGSHSKAITVQDDDASGPNLDDHADDGDIYDSDITPYVIVTKWSDPSGISSVEYRYKFGSGSWSSWSPGTQLGSNWHYEISRNTWINHVGKTIYWEARATDNDNDRSNDKSTSYSGTKTGGLISDDDTGDPDIWDIHVKEHDGDGDGKIESDEEVKIEWRTEDPSGIYKTYCEIDGDEKTLKDDDSDNYYYIIAGPSSAGSHDYDIYSKDDDNDRVDDRKTEHESGSFTVFSTERAITLYTDPSNGGTITLDGSTFNNGQSTTKRDATYSVSANPASNYEFDHWSTTGGVSVANQYSQSTTVTVSGDGSIKAWLNYVSQTGSIYATSNPTGANVYLDGAYKGVSPTTIPDVSVGSHTVKYTKSGYTDCQKTVTVTANQQTNVHCDLQTIPSDCKVQITSDPSMQDRSSIVYANGYYYVAYQSWETGSSYNGDIFIKKYDSSWNFVKKMQVTSETSYQDNPSLTFANNKLYVAYVSTEGGNYDVVLKEYDSNLNYISGSKRYLTTLTSSQDLPSLFYKDGYFYLAYQSWESGSSYGGDIYIKKFDSSWNQIKKVRVTSETSYQDRPSLTYANGYFYVAYFSDETGNYDVFVKRLDTNLNLDSWKKQVTSESSSQSFPSIIFVNNEYTIVYASYETGTLGIYMKKYDINWNFIGKTEVVDESSAHERRPSHVWDGSNYWVSYVHNYDGSDDWNIFAIIPGCEETSNNPPYTPSTPSGPSSGNTGTSYSYSTSATDPDVDQVKYTFDWDDGTTSETGLVNSGTTVSRSHSWGSAGTYYVRVKATDSEGAPSGWSASKSVTTTCTPPSTPTLNDPDTTDTDGSYTVSWSSISGATSYTLEEDTSGSFGSPAVAYSGSGTSKDITGRSDGTYYYRVKACNACGCSGWSNIKNIEVRGNLRLEGDVNSNGAITGADAQMVAQHIVGTMILTGEDAQAADVNDNHPTDPGVTPVITGADLQLIMQHVVGTITEFPAGVNGQYIP